MLYKDYRYSDGKEIFKLFHKVLDKSESRRFTHNRITPWVTNMSNGEYGMVKYLIYSMIGKI